MRAQLSRERSEIIKQTANHILSREDTSEHSENLKAVAELALLALAGMESEPVAYNQVQRDTMKDIIVRKLGGNLRGDKLVMDDIHAVTMALIQAGFRTAPPAPVAVPGELHPDTQKLVADFCAALAEKLYKAQLKYGYDADWKQDGWPTQCQAHFHQHIAKGDPRDVAAYCAFMWYHGWKTEAAKPATVAVPTFEEWCQRTEQKPVGWVREAMKEAYDGCRSAVLPAVPEQEV